MHRRTKNLVAGATENTSCSSGLPNLIILCIVAFGWRGGNGLLLCPPKQTGIKMHLNLKTQW